MLALASKKLVETKLFTKPILGIWFCFLTSLMTLNVDWADSQPDSRSESHESAAPLLSEKPGTALDNRANGIPILTCGQLPVLVNDLVR